MQEKKKKLLNSIRTTARCRFIAASRLQDHDRKLTRITAFTSAYVIALTILPYFVKLPQNITDNFNLITVAFSIVILVSTLLQYSSNEVVNAEQHHRSALEINEVYRDLDISAENLSEADLIGYAGRYNAILQKFSINHEPMDYSRLQLERPQDYPWMTRTQKISIRLRLYTASHFSTAILILITIFVLWLIFGYALPNRIN